MRTSALALVLACLFACDSGGKAKPASGSAAPAPTGSGSAPAPAPAPTSSTASLADPLAYLPADSDVVIAIDVASLRKSPLFEKYRGMLSDFVVPGFAECKYDPFDDIKLVTVGLPIATKMGVFVIRGLDRTRTLECLRTSKTETKTDALFDGDYVTLRNKSGAENLLKFVDASTAVIQGSQGPTKASLDAAIAAGVPLRNDKELVAALGKVKPDAALAIVSRPGSKLFAQEMAAKLGAPMRALTTTVHVTSVVTATFRLEMENAADATAIVTNMKPQLESVRMFVDRYDIKADGAVVTVDAVITEAQIKAFADMAKAMMGSMQPAQPASATDGR